MSTLVIPGYNGTIWNTALATLNYYNSNINASDTSSAQVLTNATASSLKNAINTMNANSDVGQIYNAYLVLSQALAIPISIDSTTAMYLQNRLTGLLAFSSNQTRFQTALPTTTAALASGQPSVPDPKYLEYVLDFIGEPIPTGLTSANFVDQAQAAANAWATYAAALLVSGQKYTGTEYQMCVAMGNASLAVAQNLVFADFSPDYDLTVLWNNLVAAPAYLTLSALIGNDPTSSVSQNTNTAKYILYGMLTQLNQLLVVLSEQISGAIQMATVRADENMMDIAARTLGNFELWQSIVSYNNLQPPYISSVGLPNTVAPGQRLFLPSSATVQAISTVPSYTSNYLGVDLCYGPIGQDMLS